MSYPMCYATECLEMLIKHLSHIEDFKPFEEPYLIHLSSPDKSYSIEIKGEPDNIFSRDKIK